MVEKNGKIAVRRQCMLLNLNRSKIYYWNKKPNKDDEILKLIENIHEEIPIYGYRKITHELRNRGLVVNFKRIKRIMKDNKISAILPIKKKNVFKKPEYKMPFLLKNEKIYKPNQVWSTDISYIKMNCGFVYLASIIDVFSRKILGYQISNVVDSELCVNALKNALETHEKPEILNTDQGSQYTSELWRDAIEELQLTVSMDGKGRWADNVYIERFWRTIKYETALLERLKHINDVKKHIQQFVYFYNFKRLHQNLNYNTPNNVYNKIVDGHSFIYAKVEKKRSQK